MCDHCVKRGNAYDGLGEDERDAVDQFTRQAEPALVLMNMTGDDAFESAYLEYGDSLDILLGIAVPTAPDFVPPDWM